MAKYYVIVPYNYFLSKNNQEILLVPRLLDIPVVLLLIPCMDILQLLLDRTNKLMHMNYKDV
jgi:hypothetical protein